MQQVPPSKGKPQQQPPQKVMAAPKGVQKPAAGKFAIASKQQPKKGFSDQNAKWLKPSASKRVEEAAAEETDDENEGEINRVLLKLFLKYSAVNNLCMACCRR